MKKLDYRPDIEGLRALSILGVLLFHFKFQLFSGGYLGVDVFLVISGFLITSFIVNRLKTGQFSVMEFITRRAKRLLPAYLVVSFLSLVFAYIFFLPDNLLTFSKSLISSVTFSSNFFFWLHSGYWSESNSNPLLHTWSLSLEWQFYFLFSITLFFLHKLFKNEPYKLIIIFFSILFLISLASAVFVHGRSIGFFLLPFRLYEFLVGFFLYFLIDKKLNFLDKNKNFFSLIGLFLIIISFIVFDSKSGGPSYISLVPCTGAALLIYLKDTFVHEILKNRAIVYIGTISYSLYLFHWPVITFYSWINIVEIEIFTKILLIIVSIILAIISYETIEKTFRKKIISNKVIKISLLSFCTLSAIVFSNIAISEKGFPERVSNEKKKLALSLSTFVGTNRSDYMGKNEDLIFDEKKDIKILVAGDSVAEDFFVALNENKNDSQIDVEFLMFSHWCFQGSKFRILFPMFNRIKLRNDHCEEEEKYIDENLYLLKKADFLVLTSSWYDKTDTFIEDIILYMRKKTSAKIIVVLRGQDFPTIDLLLQRIDSKDLSRFNEIAYESRYESSIEFNKRFKKKLDKLGVEYINKASLVCSDLEKKCTILNKKQDKLYYFDGIHWTLDGAKFYGTKINFNIFTKK